MEQQSDINPISIESSSFRQNSNLNEYSPCRDGTPSSPELNDNDISDLLPDHLLSSSEYELDGDTFHQLINGTSDSPLLQATNSSNSKDIFYSESSNCSKRKLNMAVDYPSSSKDILYSPAMQLVSHQNKQQLNQNKVTNLQFSQNIGQKMNFNLANYHMTTPNMTYQQSEHGTYNLHDQVIYKQQLPNSLHNAPQNNFQNSFCNIRQTSLQNSLQQTMLPPFIPNQQQREDIKPFDQQYQQYSLYNPSFNQQTFSYNNQLNSFNSRTFEHDQMADYCAKLNSNFREDVKPFERIEGTKVKQENKNAQVPAQLLFTKTVFRGSFDFNVEVQDCESNKNKWQFSSITKKLYVLPNCYIPITLKVNAWPPGSYVIIMPLFSKVTEMAKPVLCCFNHQDRNAENSDKIDHMIRVEQSDAIYYKRNDHGCIELPPLHPGEISSNINLQFMCMNSCEGGPKRRSFAVVFNLVQNDVVIGRDVIEIKSCKGPKRDKENEEKNIEKLTKSIKRKHACLKADMNKPNKSKKQKISHSNLSSNSSSKTTNTQEERTSKKEKEKKSDKYCYLMIDKCYRAEMIDYIELLKLRKKHQNDSSSNDESSE